MTYRALPAERLRSGRLRSPSGVDHAARFGAAENPGLVDVAGGEVGQGAAAAVGAVDAWGPCRRPDSATESGRNLIAAWVATFMATFMATFAATLLATFVAVRPGLNWYGPASGEALRPAAKEPLTSMFADQRPVAADESGCTPGSVARLPRGGRGDGHPSRAGVAAGLVRSTQGLGRAALERPRRSVVQILGDVPF